MRAAARRYLSNWRANAAQDGARTWSDWIKNVAFAVVVAFLLAGVAAHFGLLSASSTISICLAILFGQLLTRVAWRAAHRKQRNTTDGRSETG
jgi:hypothetical protein